MGLVEVGTERLKSSRVELAQGGPKLIAELLTGPDQALVGARQDLDRFGQLGVLAELPVIVPVGSHQVRQHHGVSAIRLFLRDGVAIPIAAGRQRVDGVDRVAGGLQGPHHQPMWRLDADHHLRRALGMLGHQ
jgi:hypothetical protein